MTWMSIEDFVGSLSNPSKDGLDDDGEPRNGDGMSGYDEACVTRQVDGGTVIGGSIFLPLRRAKGGDARL